MASTRLYSDQEISVILKRAGEMQATQGEAETHGLSLAELQAIAAEVGLDPRLVGAAAAELESGAGDDEGSSLLGAPTSIHIERVIPGVVSSAQWAEVSAKIGQAFDVVGRSGQVGDALEWTHTGKRLHLQVIVRPHNGQTKVRVIGKFFRIALLHFLIALIVGGLWGTIIPLSMQVAPSISLSIGAVLLVLGFVLARFGYSRYVRKKEQAADQLAQGLTDLIESSSEAAAKVEHKKPLLDDVERNVSHEEPHRLDPTRGKAR